MTELVVQVEDASLISDIKKAIGMLKGVAKVTTKRKKKSNLQLAIDEVNSGKLCEAKDVDDLIKQLHE